MPFVLFLLGAAAVGLVAASARQRGKGAGEGEAGERTRSIGTCRPRSVSRC